VLRYVPENRSSPRVEQENGNWKIKINYKAQN
jgi:hypothetical protein